MKRALLALSLATLLATGVATAVPIDPNPDGIGVYFDQGATTNCLAPTPYTPQTAYLIATRLSRGGASGWEAVLLLNPVTWPAGPPTLDMGPGVLNVLTTPDFQVGMSPSRFGSELVLLTMTWFHLGGTIYFGVAPCVPSSFGGKNPGYADPYDPAILVPLTPSSSMPWTLPTWVGQATNLPPNGPPNGFVVAAVNGCPVVANESATWGGVKDLYK